MAIEQTKHYKPDGVQRNLVGEIFTRFEKNDLRIVATRMQWLSQEEARAFMLCTASAHSLASWWNI